MTVIGEYKLLTSATNSAILPNWGLLGAVQEVEAVATRRGPWRPLLAALASLTLAAAISSSLIATADAYNGPANYYACTPNAIPNPYNNEIGNLKQATLSRCSAIPYGTYGQTSGYTNVSWRPDGQSSAWFYVQQNPDQYTQLELNGPQGSGGFLGIGSWNWYAYWRQNPPSSGCWYDEQVNEYSGGPYYHSTGYFC